MLSHLTISAKDFDPAYEFYTAFTNLLGLPLRLLEQENRFAVWSWADGSRPYLILCTPVNEQDHHSGNGQMFAFTADSPATVDACHEAALRAGCQSEGEPGLRPHYHPDYYGAYFRDPSGNKLCVVCHEPQSGTV